MGVPSLVWIGRREQVLVGLLFVLLLAVATAGRLAAAREGVLWLASPSVGMVSVDGAIRPEGPPEPTESQVKAAMQQRIRGYQSASIQTDLEIAGLKRQVAALKGQVSESVTQLLAAEQDLESVRQRLIKEQSMRENLSRELDEADRQVKVLTDRLQQAEAQNVQLKAQLVQSTAVGLAPVLGEPGQP